MLWGRGAIDRVIPADVVDRTRAWLTGHTALDEREYPMLGHGVAALELDDVAAFLTATSRPELPPTRAPLSAAGCRIP